MLCDHTCSNLSLEDDASNLSKLSQIPKQFRWAGAMKAQERFNSDGDVIVMVISSPFT